MNPRCVTYRVRALSKTRTRSILLLLLPCKDGSPSIQSGNPAVTQPDPRSASVRLCVVHGGKPGPDKYETKTPLDVGEPPVINRSATPLSTPAKKKRGMKDLKDNTGANCHMWATDMFISTFSSQSQRYEQNSSQDLVLISRCDCSWQRGSFSPCQNDQTIV